MGCQGPFSKRDKICTNILVQNFEVSIWSHAWICLFHLDSHSVLTRYPEQPYKLIDSILHGGDLYTGLNGATAVSFSAIFVLQILLKDYLLDIYFPSVLLLRDKNGSRLPNPHVALHNKSWWHKCKGYLFFHS